MLLEGSEKEKDVQLMVTVPSLTGWAGTQCSTCLGGLLGAALLGSLLPVFLRTVHCVVLSSVYSSALPFIH